jgi:hypothetical protein
MFFIITSVFGIFFAGSGGNREKKILKVDINVKTIYTGAVAMQANISDAEVHARTWIKLATCGYSVKIYKVE